MDSGGCDVTRGAATRRDLFSLSLSIALIGCDMPLARDLWASAERHAEPGPLSAAHTSLDLTCNDCHTPLHGVRANDCMVCHALNGPLVQRQNTAFHAKARSCSECHLEHIASIPLRAPLDHDLFATLAAEWPGAHAATTATGPPTAEGLECASCHGNEDPHFELFGRDCIDCHATDTWDVAGYAHPSPRSRDCAQCHQAPPSHYMKHFKMLSAKVARQPHAEVRECYVCHLTTSWPDIRGVGFYKHH